MLGPLANLCRVTCICACHELEKYGARAAGIIGNVINASCVPLTAIFAYFYFGDLMTPMEFAGSALVCVAVLMVTGGKAVRHVKGGQKEEEEEEEIGGEEKLLEYRKLGGDGLE